MINTLITKLLNGGVHLGHETNCWNPKMFPYIYKEYKNKHILDIVQSAHFLKNANSYLKNAARKNKTILFIGTSSLIDPIVKKEAERSNCFYINKRWSGGTLTNWTKSRENLLCCYDLEEKAMIGFSDLDSLKKKDKLLEIEKIQLLTRNLSGIKNMKKLPDVAIIVNQKNELTAIKECRKLSIPIISIVDTDCDPDLIDIIIPGNDDSRHSVQIILRSLSNSILEGCKKETV